MLISAKLIVKTDYLHVQIVGLFCFVVDWEYVYYGVFMLYQSWKTVCNPDQDLNVGRLVYIANNTH